MCHQGLLMNKKLLLIGGGHSHVLALLRIAPRIPSNVKIMLISDSHKAPYSGMLPGFIAGQFSRAECMIDLPALCQRLGIMWKQAAVVNINTRQQTAQLQDGASENYDVLSINVGGAPPLTLGGIGIKPADTFMDSLDSLSAASALVVIGAGAGGVETALALRRRFSDISIALVGDTFLSTANNKARALLRNILHQRQIKLYESRACDASDNQLLLSDGCRIAATRIVLATSVAPPQWLQNSNLALDDKGFISVNSQLQSVNEKAVFAAGDCAASGAPKAGVVAVRQSSVLANNLLSAFSGAPMRKWQWRRRFLYILNTADERAVAGFGEFAVAGRWVWHWKKYLDIKFMKKF